MKPGHCLNMTTNLALIWLQNEPPNFTNDPPKTWIRMACWIAVNNGILFISTLISSLWVFVMLFFYGLINAHFGPRITPLLNEFHFLGILAAVTSPLRVNSEINQISHGGWWRRLTIDARIRSHMPTFRKNRGYRGHPEKHEHRGKRDIWEIRGFPKIEENHYIRKKRDIRKIRPHIYSRTATFVVNCEIRSHTTATFVVRNCQIRSHKLRHS